MAVADAHVLLPICCFCEILYETGTWHLSTETSPPCEICKGFVATLAECNDAIIFMMQWTPRGQIGFLLGAYAASLVLLSVCVCLGMIWRRAAPGRPPPPHVPNLPLASLRGSPPRLQPASSCVHPPPRKSSFMICCRACPETCHLGSSSLAWQ